MISQELEVSLHMAFVEARSARHEFITVEHLLLALLDAAQIFERTKNFEKIKFWQIAYYKLFTKHLNFKTYFLSYKTKRG